MAAPFGNNNATKNKLWSDTLRRAIAQDDRNRLWRAAQNLLDQAASGEQWAIRELADRLDGKAQQINTIDAIGDLPISSIEVTFISPQPRNILTLDSGT